MAGYGAGAALLATPTGSLEAVQGTALLRLLFAISFALFGFALGYLLTPRLLRPLEGAYRDLRDVPPLTLTAATVGLIIGLLVSTLLAWPLSFLPAPFGNFLPFIAAVGLAVIERTRLNDFVYWQSVEAQVARLLPVHRRSGTMTEASQPIPTQKQSELIQ